MTSRGYPPDGTSGAEWLTLFSGAQDYPPDVKLFRAGQVPDDVFFIERGIVKLQCVDPRGGEQIVGLRGAGWLLGASLALLGQRAPASCVTVSRCDLRRVAAVTYLDLLAKRSDLSMHVHRMQAREILHSVRHIAEIGLQSARHRLEHVLRHLAGPADAQAPARVELPLKRCDIAALIAISAEHLSRILKQMRDEGIIEVRRGWIIIPDVKRLGPHPETSVASVMKMPAV